jgi:hypothetical protein
MRKSSHLREGFTRYSHLFLQFNWNQVVTQSSHNPACQKLFELSTVPCLGIINFLPVHFTTSTIFSNKQNLKNGNNPEQTICKQLPFFRTFSPALEPHKIYIAK